MFKEWFHAIRKYLGWGNDGFPIPELYEVIETGSVLNPVKILTGPYKGIVLYYGPVRVAGDGVLAFDHEIVENPNKRNTTGADFSKTIGDILLDVMRRGNVGELHAGQKL